MNPIIVPGDIVRIKDLNVVYPAYRSFYRLNPYLRVLKVEHNEIFTRSPASHEIVGWDIEYVEIVLPILSDKADSENFIGITGL